MGTCPLKQNSAVDNYQVSILIKLGGKNWPPAIKSDLSNRKQKFFQGVAMSVLLYGYTIWNNPGSSTQQSSSCMAN